MRKWTIRNISVNQFDLWKLYEKQMIYPQRYILFLKLKFPCSLQLSTKCSFISGKNYSDPLLLSYLSKHVMFKFTLYFLSHKTHQFFCLYKIGVLLVLDLQMFLFYIYIMLPLILTRWCYLYSFEVLRFLTFGQIPYSSGP